MNKDARKGHQYMFVDANATDDTYFPNPKVGATTDPTNADGFGVSDDGTEGVFFPGTTGKHAIIYSIVVTGAGSAATAELRQFGGVATSIMNLQAGASGIANFYNFGPEGIRIPTGFSLLTNNSTAVQVAITYDLV